MEALECNRKEVLNQIAVVGLSPLVFCEFFQGMEVIQMQGKKSKECIFGVYFNNNKVGHIYLGGVYNRFEVRALSDKYLPPHMDELKQYVRRSKGVWYYQYPGEKYVWVMNKVLKKL